MEAYHRDVEIDVRATIDPVATNQPGFRAPLNFQLQVHDNVRHDFNRCQVGFHSPLDLGTSGNLNRVEFIHRRKCRVQQMKIRAFDGSSIQRGMYVLDTS